jgi:hypothetical protein
MAFAGTAHRSPAVRTWCAQQARHPDSLAWWPKLNRGDCSECITLQNFLLQEKPMYCYF